MSVLFKLCGVALLAAGAILILGRDRDKKWAIAVCAVLLIFSQTFTGLGEILLFLREKSELAGVSAYTEPLLKGLGVGAVCLLGGSVCRRRTPPPSPTHWRSTPGSGSFFSPSPSPKRSFRR